MYEIRNGKKMRISTEIFSICKKINDGKLPLVVDIAKHNNAETLKETLNVLLSLKGFNNGS